MLTKVLIKSPGGEFEEKAFTAGEINAWLKGHSDEKGNVKDDIVLFNTAQLKGVKSENGRELFLFTFSDMTLDRDNERVNPAGAQLENFRKNPVILWGHDTRIPAIGKSEDVRYESDAIIGSIEFDDDDEFAVKIKNKVKRGIIRSGSIGFMPKRITLVEDRNLPENLIHDEWELYEFSLVNVPANTNAIRREIPESLASDIAKEVSERMEETLKSVFVKGHNKDAGGGDTSQTTNTAQTITDFLKV